MYAITVIPLRKGLPEETLTYFSKESIPLGYIVSCPFRTKTIDGIVSEIQDIKDIKYDIKNVDFALRKIDKVKGPSPFSSSFFESSEHIASYNVSRTGIVIKNLFPSVLLENMDKLKNKKEDTKINTDNDNIQSEKLIFQAPDEDRESYYRTVIRESFAKKESVFFCVPTIHEIDIWEKILSRGIEPYVFTLKNNTTKKKIIDTYNKIMTEEHPIIIISTGLYIAVDRADIKTIILENESSDSYKQISRPYIDIRTYVEVFCSIKKCKLIFGDSFLRLETLYKYENKFYNAVSSPIFRLQRTQKQILVDMKDELNQKGMKEFNILSKVAREMISYALENNKKIILYTLRKGLAPTTACKDCGTQVTCPHCDTPLVLYGEKQLDANKHKKERVFMCNKCSYKENTEIRCKVCNSWNLIPLGIGTETLYQELSSLYPNTKIIQIDKESTPTQKEAEIRVDEFYNNTNSILIGNEMLFSYLRDQVDYSIIVSLDGLLSIPNFNIMLRIMHTIDNLQKITKENTIIQTRQKDNKMLTDILSGNILPLYRSDLREREIYSYPPYKRLIKITFRGNSTENQEAREYINTTLGIYDPQIFSVFKSKIKGEYITNTILKIDTKLWQIDSYGRLKQDEELKILLSSLSHDFIINIDPEDLL